MNESFFTTAPSLLKEQLQRFDLQVHPPSFLFHVHSILCSLSSLTLSSLRAGSNWASARLVIIIFAINAKGVFLPRPEGSREAGGALPSLNSAHEVPVGLRNRPLGNLPADSSIVFILLCSFSLLLLTKHLSTRRGRKSTFHLPHISEKEIHRAGFSILRICDGTEARFIKLSLGSYLSWINKGWK